MQLEDVVAAFQRFDKDGNGKVCFKEFVAFISQELRLNLPKGDIGKVAVPPSPSSHAWL